MDVCVNGKVLLTVQVWEYFSSNRHYVDSKFKGIITTTNNHIRKVILKINCVRHHLYRHIRGKLLLYRCDN